MANLTQKLKDIWKYLNTRGTHEEILDDGGDGHSSSPGFYGRVPNKTTPLQRIIFLAIVGGACFLGYEKIKPTQTEIEMHKVQEDIWRKQDKKENLNRAENYVVYHKGNTPKDLDRICKTYKLDEEGRRFIKRRIREERLEEAENSIRRFPAKIKDINDICKTYELDETGREKIRRIAAVNYVYKNIPIDINDIDNICKTYGLNEEGKEYIKRTINNIKLREAEQYVFLYPIRHDGKTLNVSDINDICKTYGLDETGREKIRRLIDGHKQ